MSKRKRMRVVQVVGTGKASAVPDVVRLSVGLRCDAAEVSGALRDVGTRVQAVGEAARAHGIASADISSSGAGVQPRYTSEGRDVIGYQAYHSLTIVVRALDDVGTVVDAIAGRAGNALTIDAIQLDLSDKAPLEESAREAAFAAAHAKAEQYASLSGADLGPVVAVVEGAAPGGPSPMPRMAMMARDSAAMPVEAGEQTVTATVSVTWALDTTSAADAPEDSAMGESARE